MKHEDCADYVSDIEKSLGVAPVPLIREHPMSSLYDAAKRLIETHARRLPLLDNDTETGHEVIVSVLTQYRLLKFISINVSQLIHDCRCPYHESNIPPKCAKDVAQLHLPLRKLKIGTFVEGSFKSADEKPSEEVLEKIKANPYYPIATATLDTRVFDVVHMFSEQGISAVPIVDSNGVVVNLYETVDVIVSSEATLSLDFINYHTRHLSAWGHINLLI